MFLPELFITDCICSNLISVNLISYNDSQLENGYRDYSDEDLETLLKVSLFRKLGIGVNDIGEYLSYNGNSLSTILRKKQYLLYLEEKRNSVLELIIRGESQEKINEKIKLIESEESIYERLERLFPGYFGQMMFAAYQPFLNEVLNKDGKDAFEKFIIYLDSLPSFELSKDEQNYIDDISSTFNMCTLKKVNEDKINAIENFEDWIKENNKILSEYEIYKNSEEHQNNLMLQIQNKVQKFMKDNKYYEIAIPLIRTFSKSYNEYYENLLKVNEVYLNTNK